MIALRSLFVVILLNYLVLTESSKLSKIYRSLIGKRSDESVRNDYPTSTSNRTDESSIEETDDDDDDESAVIEHIDCSDLNSTLGRALKWVLISTSNSQHVPKVRFFMSSRTQPTRVEVHVGDQFRLDATDFKVERRTVFIVHGFKSGGFKNWVKRMEEAFLLWGDVNVIVVDWAGSSRSFNYYHAAVNTKVVGNTMARFLQHLMNATRTAKSPLQPSWGTLHLVGHSLGAHICGVAARDFKEMQHDWHVSRITGLDPAQLCFRGVNLDFRLDSTDANFVDVIHTSAKTKSSMGFGNPEPIGHIDFYANGGRTQPGCAKRNKSVLKYLRVPKTSIEIGQCNHQRSYLYFTESLVSAAKGNCTFWARRWDPSDLDATRISWEACDARTCTEMGIQSENQSQRGTFFVPTSQSPPFCIPTPKQLLRSI